MTNKYESTLSLHFTDIGSPGHRLQSIVLDNSSTVQQAILKAVSQQEQGTARFWQTAMSPDTDMSAAAGVPHIVLQDITKLSYVVSDDNTLWYRNADIFIQIKPCEVKVLDVLKDHKLVPNDCDISKCGTKNCKTCNTGILITDTSF